MADESVWMLDIVVRKLSCSRMENCELLMKVQAMVCLAPGHEGVLDNVLVDVHSYYFLCNHA